MRRMMGVMLMAAALALAMPVMAGEADLSILTEGKTDWYFSEEEVEEADLMAILEAGVNTASALNESPWTITVVKDREIIQLLADAEGTKPAPVMIIVSVPDSNEMKILDAGLSVQSMQIAARMLGYATKIETTAARVIRRDKSGEWRSRLQIPEGKAARAALFIGHADEMADALSQASSRAAFLDVVTFIE